MAEFDYYLRYGFLTLLMGYHLMELDMIKIAFPGFLEDYGVLSKDNRKESLTYFSSLYAQTLNLGIVSTLFWGWASDRFGCFRTSVVHMMIHSVITVLIAYSKTYEEYTNLYLALSFFSNYTISLNTFMGWLPKERKQSFVAKSQFISSTMLQLAPLVVGVILKFTETDIIFRYHLFLAGVLSFLTVGYAYAFRNYIEEVAPTGTKAEAQEAEDLKGLKGYLVILKDKTALSLLLFGIYLRLVKKLVDVAVHLWAELGENENGLGFDKITLGTYSSVGGMLSVILYLYFAKEDIDQLPGQLRLNLILCGVCVFCFPFLNVLPKYLLNVGLAVLILIFNFCFSALFSVWIGLLNTGVRKEIRSKSFALTLAIRSIIGGWITNKCFELLKWSLSAKEVTEFLGGKLNSAVFFWLFTGVNLVTYLYFRNMRVRKQEKDWELLF